MIGGDNLGENTVHTNIGQSCEDDFDQSLRTIEAIDDEKQLFNIIIETDLSEKAIRKALKKIHNEDMIIEITIEDDSLSDDLVRFAYGLLHNQEALMFKVFSLAGQKTLRLREIAAGTITRADCLSKIMKMESNEEIRNICKRKLQNRITA